MLLRSLLRQTAAEVPSQIGSRGSRHQVFPKISSSVGGLGGCHVKHSGVWILTGRVNPRSKNKIHLGSTWRCRRHHPPLLPSIRALHQSWLASSCGRKMGGEV